ncbi:MAG: hypothetical protein ACREFW_09515 [Rhizomicrobium sp.]
MERAAEVIQDRAQVAESEYPAGSGFAREYHVTFDGRHWNVETVDGESLDFARDRDLAVRLAIRAARHACAEGFEAMVCVQQQDGTSTVAWSS